MLFESHLHADSVFVTLTYDQEHLPHDGSINKRDPQLFLKRLRKRLASEDHPRKTRYFLSGEYGDKLGRPHYHAILFGLSVLDHETVAEAWDQGFVTTAPLTPGRMAYCAKYLQKKIIKAGVDRYDDGRLSEFALMSRRPGLGSAFINAMAHGIKRQAENPNVSLAGLARVDGRKYPIDRYGRDLLKSRLVELGVPWRDAERFVCGAAGKAAPENGLGTGFTFAGKVDRQNRFGRQAEGRKKVLRDSGPRVH